ncbi:ATP-dependent Clp protease ATP-binding subunit [Candidatus Dojkabacteria bacterium]|nr:ATP-dependent Clp protease ATP-binding subunit [Candidatus Dojkabacteria bacterium]
MKKPFTRFTKNAFISLRLATTIADRMKSVEVKPKHLFLGLILNRAGIASRVLSAIRIDIAKTFSSFSDGIDLSDIKSSRFFDKDKAISEDLSRVIGRAFSIAHDLNHVYVGTEHLLMSILHDKKFDFVKDLAVSGITLDSVRKNILSFTSYPQGVLSKPPIASDAGKPSALDIFGRNLTDLAKKSKLDPVIGRDKEIDELINILSRRRKNNPIVVGEAGVGKTALIEGLAQRIVKGDVPDSLRNTVIISLDVTGIVAGSKMRGDMEEKMMAVINEVASVPNMILFIDEIHTILGAGAVGGGGLDIAGVLKPALVHGDFRCIGATTVADYNRYFEEEPALSRRFQKVLVEESSVEDTVQILKNLRPLLEAHHNVVITDDAIEYAVRLSDQYVSDRYLPDKAIDLMDEAAAARRLEIEKEYDSLGDVKNRYKQIIEKKEGAIDNGEFDVAINLRKEQKKVENELYDLKKARVRIKKNKKFQVDAKVVREIISRWTNIPLTTLDSTESSELIHFEDTLASSVIGQNEAVLKVANAIKRARTGVTSVERPWASFLFLGPTGVGKTELAKVLTRELFGDEDRLIQVDMSEMMEMHSVSKLIGSPPGYVGYREGGQLTEKVRLQPHSVILFDEIEKAHIDVLNLLLQILEYGHLTDGKGRRVNFKNTVIILTSNIGAEDIRRDKVLGFQEADVRDRSSKSDKEIESAYDGMKEKLLDQLKKEIRPELLNRLDDIVIFRTLTRKDARKIVDLLLGDLNGRLEDQNVKVDLTDEAKDFIVTQGFSEEYGARPLRRTIQDFVETPVANYLLKYGGGVVLKGKKAKPERKKLLIAVDKEKHKLSVSKVKSAKE